METCIRNYLLRTVCPCSLPVLCGWCSHTLEANGETSGFAGILVAFLMLAGGIVSITTRKSLKNGGNIALIVLFLLASLVGFSCAGSFKDLNIWSAWCLINAMLAVISLIGNRKKA